MLEKTQWSDPFNFCSGIYSHIKITFQLVEFQFEGAALLALVSFKKWPHAKHSNIQSRPRRGLDPMF